MMSGSRFSVPNFPSVFSANFITWQAARYLQVYMGLTASDPTGNVYICPSSTAEVPRWTLKGFA